MAYRRHMALRNRSESILPEVMWPDGTNPLPKPILTYHEWHLFQGGMNLNIQDIKPQFVVEIYFWDPSHIPHITRGQWVKNKYITASLLWRRNGTGGVSNHQPHHCLLNRSFGYRSKKTSKLRATGLCAGNSPGTGEFPAQMASNAENASIWWRHHVLSLAVCLKTQCHCAL